MQIETETHKIVTNKCEKSIALKGCYNIVVDSKRIFQIILIF